MLWRMPYPVWMSVELLTDFDLCMHTQQLLLITVGRLIFEDKIFRGFRKYFPSLENIFPRNVLF